MTTEDRNTHQLFLKLHPLHLFSLPWPPQASLHHLFFLGNPLAFGRCCFVTLDEVTSDTDGRLVLPEGLGPCLTGQPGSFYPFARNE